MMAEEPPSFVEHPQNQFIVKNDPVTLSCSARAAADVRFKCNGIWMKNSETHSRQGLAQISIQVTKDDLDTFFGPHKEWCRCEAWSRAGHVKSNKAYVKLANLRRNFERDPVGGKFVVGDEIKLGCSPPKGDPHPLIQWMKNDQPLAPSSNYLVTDDGSLIIQARSVSDSGNFTCVARNAAAKRRSHTASVKVGVNGEWSPWSSWPGCGEQCGINIKQRTRECNQPKPQNGGADCPGESIQTQLCTKLCPVDGGWTDWSPWSTCSPKCVQRRRRTCTKPLPHNDGRVCSGSYIESQSCNNGYCLGNDSQRNPLYNTSGSSLYLGLMVTLGILLFFVIATLFFMKYKKKRSCFSLRKSSPRKLSYSTYNCKECQGAPFEFGYFNHPDAHLPPYAFHEPTWGYTDNLSQSSCSKNKLLISSSSSDLSEASTKCSFKSAPDLGSSEASHQQSPEDCDASFQTRLKCSSV